MKQFNVIFHDTNEGDFIKYDVIPYFVRCYKNKKKQKNKELPSTFEEFKKFVENESRYMFWSRCEYELILSSWPPIKNEREKKIDIHWQIMMNIDNITDIVMNECLKK